MPSLLNYSPPSIPLISLEVRPGRVAGTSESWKAFLVTHSPIDRGRFHLWRSRLFCRKSVVCLLAGSTSSEVLTLKNQGANLSSPAYSVLARYILICLDVIGLASCMVSLFVCRISLGRTLNRRHLTTGQKAIIDLKAEEMYARNAQERQVEVGKQTAKKNKYSRK